LFKNKRPPAEIETPADTRGQYPQAAPMVAAKGG
jgi:hypothetical protein